MNRFYDDYESEAEHLADIEDDLENDPCDMYDGGFFENDY